MKFIFRLVLFGAFFSLYFLFGINLVAKVYFSSMSSSIVLKDFDSHFKIGNVNGLSGWGQQSIVKFSGLDNSWISNNTIYGDSIGEAVPPTHLLYSNSNAIRTECEHFIHDNNAKLSVLGSIIGETSIPGRGILSSPINLNGATLTNGGDLIFSSKTEFVYPGGILNPRGFAYILGGDMVLPDGIDLCFTSSGIIDGQGHSLIFEGSSRIRLDSCVTVTFKNIKIQKLKNFYNGGSICSVPFYRCGLAFENSTINLSNTFSFTAGHLYFHGDVVFTGSGQFNFTSTHNAYIAENSQLFFDLGMTFSYGPLCDDRELIKMMDGTSVLCFNGCNLNSTTTGFALKKGRLVIGNKNYLYNQDYFGKPAISLSEAVVFGDGNESNDLTLEILAGGSLNLKSGILDYKNLN